MRNEMSLRMRQSRLSSFGPRAAIASALALALTVSFLSVAAQAQSETEGFALDSFEPSERGSEWFSQDSLDLRGHLRPAIGLVADYGHEPLVIYDANGDEIGPLVEHQLFLHLGASLVLWERLRLAANLPFSPVVKGNDSLVGTQTYPVDDGASLGDLRLSADLR